MNILGLHFHSWTEVKEWVTDLGVYGGRYLKNHYRYCECGKWQICYGNYGGIWWEDCPRPFNAEKLCQQNRS